MSTRQDKIPPQRSYLHTESRSLQVSQEMDRLFTQRSDATRWPIREQIGREPDWRDFVNQFLPERFKLDPTELVLEKRERERIKWDLIGKYPKLSLDEIDIMTEDIYQGTLRGETGIFPQPARGVLERIGERLPRLSTLRREAVEEAIGPIKTIAEIGMSMGELLGLDQGPAAFADITPLFGTFSGRLYSQLDNVFSSLPQNKATGKQWASALSRGVPEHEAIELRTLLSDKIGDKVITKAEVEKLKNFSRGGVSDIVEVLNKFDLKFEDVIRYIPPKVGEVVFGAVPNVTWFRFSKVDDKTYRSDVVGGLTLVKRGKQNKWDLFNYNNAHMMSFNSVGEAENFFTKPKYFNYVAHKDKVEDYSEIVLTLDSPNKLYNSPHWYVDNPLLHLRLGTREVPSLGVKARQIEELQSDWGQTIRKFGVMKPPEDLPLVNFKEIEKLPLQRTRRGDTPLSSITEYKRLVYEGVEFDLFYEGDLIIAVRNNEENMWNFTSGYNKGQINDLIQSLSQVRKVPNMPFAKTEQWVQLGIQRAIQNAIDHNTPLLTWSSAELQRLVSGTDAFIWRKTHDGFFVTYTHATFTPPAEIEFGDFLSGSRIELIGSKEGLVSAIRNSVTRKPTKDVNKLADKIWERVETNPSGSYLPRYEGNVAFYDKSMPIWVERTVKKMGVDPEIIDIARPGTFDYPTTSQKALRITPELINAVEKKGFRLFGVSGGMFIGSYFKDELMEDSGDENSMNKLFK